eukprot:g18239.t1
MRRLLTGKDTDGVIDEEDSEYVCLGERTSVLVQTWDKCWRCGRNGGDGADCSCRPVGTHVCFKCGGENHKAADCPNKNPSVLDRDHPRAETATGNRKGNVRIV